MHKEKENQWEQWAERTIDGTVYLFDHLRPFDMPVVKEARGTWPEFRTTVRVVFDCHVVTEDAEFVASDSRYWLDLGGRGRLFVLERHQYSYRLPELISGLSTGQVKCYIAKKNNYMVWENGDTDSGTEHYQVYFDLYKPKTQPPGEIPLLILYVQSAYLKSEPFAKQRERFQAFGQICAQLTGVIQPKEKGPRSKKKK
ncbi:MAG: hypothetical protein Q7R60_01085 [bacterium]|nr:hypothetical protein [bacterium]